MSGSNVPIWLVLLQSVPSTFLAVLPVINPIGTGLILNTMTYGVSGQDRRDLGKKIALNCMVLYTAFLFLGPYILSFFGISLPIIRVCGGALLAFMGWNMINQKEVDSSKEESSKHRVASFEDKVFYPFSFPITAGPGVISVILALGVHHSNSAGMVETLFVRFGSLVGLAGVAVVCYLCFVYSNLIQQRLGAARAQAVNRLMAFFTLCIGAQILSEGVRAL